MTSGIAGSQDALEDGGVHRRRGRGSSRRLRERASFSKGRGVYFRIVPIRFVAKGHDLRST